MTPTDRFVEAMQHFKRHLNKCGDGGCSTTIRDAVEAFADVTFMQHYRVESGPLYEDENGELEHEVRNVPYGPTRDEHHAALLKRVMGGEDV